MNYNLKHLALLRHKNKCVKSQCNSSFHAVLMDAQMEIWILYRAANFCPVWWFKKLQLKCISHCILTQVLQFLHAQMQIWILYRAAWFGLNAVLSNSVIGNMIWKTLCLSAVWDKCKITLLQQLSCVLCILYKHFSFCMHKCKYRFYISLI